MGLDFSYLLYFERGRMWNALQRVVKIAEKHNPPTVTHFPVHDLPIPLKPVLLNQSEYQHDDPLIVMGTVLFFQEDEVILDYLEQIGSEYLLRSPPGSGMCCLNSLRQAHA